MSNAPSNQVVDGGGINVSVIIAAYKAAETVAETLSSVRAETHTGWQAIVDDGSSDDTVACAQRLAAHDQRIRLVPQERMGVSAARYKGITVAHFEGNSPW